MQLLSDLRFHVPAFLEAEAKAAVGCPVWLYSFDHFSEAVLGPSYPWKGSIHRVWTTQKGEMTTP